MRGIDFCRILCGAGMLLLLGGSFAGAANDRILAQDHLVLAEASEPLDGPYAHNPGLARLPSGRLIATYNIGRGYIKTSDDRGLTWTERGGFPFVHARPFVAGESVYLLGHAGDLMVMRSDDWGESWSEPVKLTEGDVWHQAPCNVHYANGHVYLVMERRDMPKGFRGWPVKHLAPVMMRARVTEDLTKREAWTFASEMYFRDAVDVEKVAYLGVPFYPHDPDGSKVIHGSRRMQPPGWLETNIVQITDPAHLWHDPDGRTFHLYMRANTGMTNIGALAKVVENEDGSMSTELERAPSGKEVAFLPLPGGHMKFHILYDEESRLYWLLSTQSTDSMRRPEMLGADRFSLADNERQHLQLHFSSNAIDWRFAGLVASGNSQKEARHYASMVIDGEDLHFLSRSGNENARSAHDTNRITFHTIRDFRSLIY